jgi:Tfp pilus assembly protein PilV
MQTTPLHRQRGISLIESLVGFLVLSLGLLGVTHMHTSLRQNADTARQRTEAVRMAQQEIERLRGFASTAAYDDIANAQQSSNSQPTTFTLVRNVDDASTGGTIKATSVATSWSDRTGAVQAITLSTTLAGTLPVYSGILGMPSQDKSVSRPAGRAQRIPLGAKNLGDGRSVLKPGSRTGTALVFNQSTGLLASVCTNLATTLSQDSLSPSDLQQCQTVSGTVVTGYIRFSLGATADAVHANDAPMPLSLAMSLDQASGSQSAGAGCANDAMKTVRFVRNGESHTQTVLAQATPADVGATDWVEQGERFVAYTCWVLTATAQAGWSGQLAVSPEGWALGTTADTFKVCRYSADTDGSGTIDRNEEHPARYTDVRDALAQQNYLVVRGDVACPSGLAAATVQHQP